MRSVTIDRSKCQGYGNCVMAAPGIFDLDESDKTVLLVDRVAEESLVEIKQAVRECPTGALALED
jgi:ferredoxin